MIGLPRVIEGAYVECTAPECGWSLRFGYPDGDIPPLLIDAFLANHYAEAHMADAVRLTDVEVDALVEYAERIFEVFDVDPANPYADLRPA